MRMNRQLQNSLKTDAPRSGHVSPFCGCRTRFCTPSGTGTIFQPRLDGSGFIRNPAMFRHQSLSAVQSAFIPWHPGTKNSRANPERERKGFIRCGYFDSLYFHFLSIPTGTPFLFF
jgi:hypothetical protein